MARNSQREPAYAEYVKVAYTDARAGPLERARIEAMCEGTPLYRQLKTISIKSQMGLLDIATVTIESQVNVVSKDINIGGNVQAGTISTGDAASSGTTTNYSAAQQVALQKIIADVDQLLELSGIPKAVRDEGKAAVDRVKERAEPSRLRKLADFLSKLGDLGVASEKILTTAGKIASAIGVLSAGLG